LYSEKVVTYSFEAVVPSTREAKEEKSKRKGEEEFLSSISIPSTPFL
jgi:hypothetical protein